MRLLLAAGLIAVVAALAGCSTASPRSSLETDPKPGACAFPVDVAESNADDGLVLRVERADRAIPVRDLQFRIEVPGEPQPSSEGNLSNASHDSGGQMRFIDASPEGTLSLGDEIRIATSQPVIAWLFQDGKAIATNGRCL